MTTFLARKCINSIPDRELPFVLASQSITYMMGMRAGRINSKIRVYSLLFNEFCKDAFSSGRPTDIAHTHKRTFIFPYPCSFEKYSLTKISAYCNVWTVKLAEQANFCAWVDRFNKNYSLPAAGQTEKAALTINCYDPKTLSLGQLFRLHPLFD
jgi:hypothetical protein